MNMPDHLVFLVPIFDSSAPRTIRVKNIIPCLSEQYRITVVCLSGDITEISTEKSEQYEILRVPYSWLSRNITIRRYSNRDYNVIVRSFVRALSYVIQRFGLFPDAWIYERKNILKALRTVDQPIDILIASMMPFSTAKMAFDHRDGVSENGPIVICDIGDPLSKNIILKVRHGVTKRKRYEQYVVDNSDHIITTNKMTVDYYCDQFGAHAENVSCVPQGAPVSNSKVVFDNSESDHGAEQAVNMVYAGIFIDKARDPRLLFDILKQFQNEIRVQVCGGINQYFKTDNDHVQFRGEIPHSEIHEFYGQGDLLLYIDNSHGIQTSGKIYELLALRKPILFLYSGANSAVKDECSGFGHIIYVQNNELDLQFVLSDIKMRMEQANVWLESNSDYNISDFSWDTRASQFLGVIRTAHERSKQRRKKSIENEKP